MKSPKWQPWSEGPRTFQVWISECGSAIGSESRVSAFKVKAYLHILHKIILYLSSINHCQNYNVFNIYKIESLNHNPWKSILQSSGPFMTCTLHTAHYKGQWPQTFHIKCMVHVTILCRCSSMVLVRLKVVSFKPFDLDHCFSPSGLSVHVACLYWCWTVCLLSSSATVSLGSTSTWEYNGQCSHKHVLLFPKAFWYNINKVYEQFSEKKSHETACKTAWTSWKKSHNYFLPNI